MLNYSPTPRLWSLSCENTQGLLEGSLQDHPSTSLLHTHTQGFADRNTRQDTQKQTQYMAELECYKACGLG